MSDGAKRNENPMNRLLKDPDAGFGAFVIFVLMVLAALVASLIG